MLAKGYMEQKSNLKNNDDFVCCWSQQKHIFIYFSITLHILKSTRNKYIVNGGQ